MTPPDGRQTPWLLEIKAGTRERLGEAQRMQWLGEVAGLRKSLRHIAVKKRRPNAYGHKQGRERTEPAPSAEQSH